jgi:hypothetical protein
MRKSFRKRCHFYPDCDKRQYTLRNLVRLDLDRNSHVERIKLQIPHSRFKKMIVSTMHFTIDDNARTHMEWNNMCLTVSQQDI